MGVLLQGGGELRHRLVVPARPIEAEAEPGAHLGLARSQLDGPAGGGHRFVGAAGGFEDDRRPEVGGGVAGIELQRAPQFRFGPGPVPVSMELGETEDGMGFRQAVVERHGPEGGLFGSGIVIEQGAGFGQTREGGREIRVRGGGLLETLESRADVVRASAGEQLPALGGGFDRFGARRAAFVRRRQGEGRRDLQAPEQQDQPREGGNLSHGF